VQFNRGAHLRADEKLALSDPRESGSVGKDAAG